MRDQDFVLAAEQLAAFDDALRLAGRWESRHGI
jgi:hypothetical protein